MSKWLLLKNASPSSGPAANSRYGIDRHRLLRPRSLSPCIREGKRGIRGAQGSASFFAQPLTSWQTANPFSTRARKMRRSLFLARSQAKGLLLLSSGYEMVSPRSWVRKRGMYPSVSRVTGCSRALLPFFSCFGFAQSVTVPHTESLHFPFHFLPYVYGSTVPNELW